MLAYTYEAKDNFTLKQKPKPVLKSPQDAIVRVTLSSICTSDLHITHTFPLKEIEQAYDIFENKKEHVIKVAVEP